MLSFFNFYPKELGGYDATVEGLNPYPPDGVELNAPSR